HPASLGGTDAAAQATVLDFYDPDRSTPLLKGGEPADRQTLLAAFAALRPALAEQHGEGLRILSGAVASPTLGTAIDAVLARYPSARWHQSDAVSRDNVRPGAALAYGRPVDVLPRAGAANVILGLDSDLISSAPGHVRHAREFASRRNPTRAQMSRVYAIEPTPGLLGAAADHRFLASAAELERIAAVLGAALLRNEAPPGDAPPWLAPVIADLRAQHGHALIHAGPDLSAEAQALVLAMNESLGARGTTLDVVESAWYRPPGEADGMAGLLADMQAGRVSALVILGGNPAYTEPGFADALGRVTLSMHLAPALDETGARATWFVPEAHEFEAWGDVRAYDGTATIRQPMALPLYGGWSAIELLSLLTATDVTLPLEALRKQWPGSDDAWREALATGVVSDTASKRADVTLRSDAGTIAVPAPPGAPIELLIRPDPHLWDGRHANNAWLQELPRPLTKLTWDNPLLVSPALARDHGLANGDEVEVARGGNTLRVPVWIMPGQAASTAVGLLGFGRRVVGEVGRGAGYDFYPLRDTGAAVTLTRTGRTVPIACTDHHNPLDVPPDTIAPIVRHATLAAFERKPDLLQEKETYPSLYRRLPGGTVAWGMSVDLNACIGCNACVVACTAENNVPVVGKEEVLRQREMHWLRIDRYWEGDADDPRPFFQPMLCQHCEQAPCEVVCPVGATVHDEEGLNVMVYNRCVGTRFCSNNCPYKVRRFNYLAYADTEHRPPLARNNDVSVRSRGVMEKCNFCLQRIAEARIAHDRDGTPQTVVTACQAACPTRAFSFGDINQADSEVVARKKSPLDYALLAERNTHPRLTYEGRIINSNPDLQG
ncbi:MAG: 4Fe-4S dicluster domain-containing protein, partial [Acetobacteraceae bacterium]|nr:4Fe-4S dicluster domain-containing protein [Acetobacteraceae bacterium]